MTDRPGYVGWDTGGYGPRAWRKGGSNHMSNSRAWAGLAVIAALFVGTPLLVYFYGIPWVAGLAAGAVPVAWEEELGRLSAAQLASGYRACPAAPAQRLLDRLSRAAPEHRYHLNVQVVDTPEVNAFAAPGGSIVVFRGLLDLMESPDEFAAVLAHETVHVLRRHTTRAMLRQVSLAFLLSYVTGDAAGLMGAAAGKLGGLHYQRGDETEADRYGMALLAQAGVNAEALPRMLERLRHATPGAVRVPAWVSSHPDLDRRIAEARSRARDLGGPRSSGALAPEDWTTLRNSCRP